jgi:branched-chain amino acid transport system ATP-binding protein
MAEDGLLELDGVHTHVGSYHILQGVTFAVAAGRITLLAGRNGTGKSTTLRTIMGLWPASGGRVVFDGRDITAASTPEIARLGIGYVPENRGIFSGLSVAENLALAVRGKTLSAARLDWIVNLFPPLRAVWEARAATLSGGEKQMLSVARVLVEPRRLLLIDEPTNGLAPGIVINLARALRALVDEGITILLVEQTPSFAAAIAHAVAGIDDGRIVHQGTMASFAADSGLQQRLLGVGYRRESPPDDPGRIAGALRQSL